MGLEAEVPPDSPDGGLRQAAAPGHGCPGPVGGAPGQLLQGGDDDLLDLVQQIDGGWPGRSSSCSPSSRSRTNRPRQRATLCSVVRRSAATCLLFAPSAQASTIRARSARTWEVFARRAHRTSWSRSASARTSPALRLPARGLSASPPGPSSANRSRHFLTVPRATPRSAATPEFPAAAGSAQASTIRARSATRADPDRSSRPSSARSSSDSTSGAAGIDTATYYKLMSPISGG